MKTCNKCGINKERDQYNKHSKTKDGLHPTCKPCLKTYNKLYYITNKERIKKTVKEHKKKNRKRHNIINNEERRKLKIQVFDAYGSKCACCNEEAIEFLTLDHVNGDGAEHRRRLAQERGVKKIRHDTIYREVRRNGYPDTFRVLCMNCNFSYGIHGYCPHATLSSN